MVGFGVMLLNLKEEELMVMGEAKQNRLGGEITRLYTVS